MDRREQVIREALWAWEPLEAAADATGCGLMVASERGRTKARSDAERARMALREAVIMQEANSG